MEKTMLDLATAIGLASKHKGNLSEKLQAMTDEEYKAYIKEMFSDFREIPLRKKSEMQQETP